MNTSNVEKASYITVQWALQETQNILRKADEEAERIKKKVVQELTEAQEKNHAAWLALMNANHEADRIVREAYIVKQTAEGEFQRFISLFKDKVKLLTIQSLEELL